MTSMCLLVFSKEENRAVLRIVQRLQKKVDEIVIIDNSSSKTHSELESLVSPYDARVSWTLSLGYPEPFGEYAMKKVRSDFILRIDTDEEPSESLITNLRELDTHDASFVTIREPYAAETYRRIRLFRKSAVKFTGYIHDELLVTGSSSLLKEECYLTHLRRDSKSERYFAIEAVEHPLPYFYLESSRIPSGVRSFLKKASSDGTLRGILTWMIISMKVGKSIVFDPRPWTSRSWLQYVVACYRYLERLPVQERIACEKTAQQISQCRSVISFLGLHDQSYVESLSEAFRKESLFDGPKNFHDLALARYELSRPLSVREVPDLKEITGRAYLKASAFPRE